MKNKSFNNINQYKDAKIKLHSIDDYEMPEDRFEKQTNVKVSGKNAIESHFFFYKNNDRYKRKKIVKPNSIIQKLILSNSKDSFPRKLGIVNLKGDGENINMRFI